MQSNVHRLRVISLAPRAKAWLEQTKQAHVLYAFERVINLVNQEGEILALATSSIGDGPFTAVLDDGLFPRDAQVDTTLLVFENGLWLGDWLIDAENALAWQPVPGWAAARRGSASWAISPISTLLQKHAQPDSFARLLIDPVANSTLPTRILQAAEQNIPLLLTAIAESNTDLIIKASKALAGIGPGLTPAGDDLLLGAMHGLWSTRPAEDAERLCRAIARAATPRTHLLSAAWLTAGASGEAAQPWHQLVTALAEKNQAALEVAILRILPTGHTSGADSVAGLLGVLKNSRD